jgi:hypothetical protein
VYAKQHRERTRHHDDDIAAAMTSYFLQNLYLGTKLTDEQLADIPHYRFELHYHVLYKGAQVRLG